MPRIAAPATIEASPAASQPLLEGVKRLLGSVPNLFRTVALSPPALQGYLARISHTNRRIGAPNQRKLLCRNDFAQIRGAPDADRV
jgi:hypothetical protein